MFDQNTEPVDIFAETDPVRPSAPAARPPEPPIMRGPSRWLLAFVLLVVLGGLGGGAYWFLVMRTGSQNGNLPAEDVLPTPTPTAPDVVPGEAVTPPIAETEPPIDETITEPPVTDESPTVPTEDVMPEPFVDTDADGLSDVEEARLGTDPLKSDTDGDDLTDRDEVLIYKTDPLNEDTDGDGYLDGAEVKGGYNPNGPGKLFGMPNEGSL